MILWDARVFRQKKCQLRKILLFNWLVIRARRGVYGFEATGVRGCHSDRRAAKMLQSEPVPLPQFSLLCQTIGDDLIMLSRQVKEQQ
jgi:hypothetical protein